ncbi:MAG: CPBP family intramembrane metalloprotease [Clostridiales bacterium]|nr:CPBP family intramembrane metalloprotease [Clostridiales bacterium]
MRRGTKAIIKSFFNFTKGAGAKASAGAFVSCLVFLFVLICVLASFALWFFPYHLWSDEVFNIIIVNAPDSFIEYNGSTEDSRESKRDNYGSLTDLKNYENIISYEYTYDNYGYSEFIYKENDAAYDFLTYQEWMKQEDAYLTIVFPEDFDEMIDERFSSGEISQVEVLTYYRTDSLEYGDMKKQFIDDYLGNYQNYLRKAHNVTALETTDFRISDEPIADPKGASGIAAAAFAIGKTIVPLVIFIVILFAAMSSGTSVIAGQKENGTFTEIIMSPLPRSSIIIGNITGVTIKALIPALIVVLFTQTNWRFITPGIIAVLIYVISLAVLISAIVILTSVINDSVISAQTAFLPIFLLLIAVCVTCIQNYREVSEVFFFFPIYGHFYGIGTALANETNIPALISCVLSSGALTAGIGAVSSRLLHKERFTVSVESVKQSEIRTGDGSIKLSFTERADRIASNISFYTDQVFYPFAVLSVFQLVAVIPTVISFMSRAEYTQYIMNLQNVSSIEDIITTTMEVFGMFLSDPLFLGLMLPGYILMILAYLLRIYNREKIRPFTACFGKLGLPLDSRAGIVRSYLTGLVLGLLMMGSVLLILIITGQVSYISFGLEGGITATFIINLLMWIPQGMTEEIMFRGFMIPRVKDKSNTAVAVILSSFLFAAFHSANIGFTPLAAINLFLIALLFALIYLKTGNIWMTSAIHTMWNLTQGNIIGLQVSGTEAASSVLKTVYCKSSMDIVTGGAFGSEGGLAVTAVTVTGLIILLLLSSLQRIRRKQKRGTESA